MQNTITIVQIIVAIALVVLILIQQRDSDISGFLGGGGGGGGGFYQQRRGLERLFVWLTVILAVAFAALALARVFLAPQVSVTSDTNAAATSTADTAPFAPVSGGAINIVGPTSTDGIRQ